MRKSTMHAKKSAVFISGRRGFSGSGIWRAASTFIFSLLRKIATISRPITTENTTAPTARPIPNSKPSTRALKKIARMLIAGPE